MAVAPPTPIDAPAAAAAAAAAASPSSTPAATAPTAATSSSSSGSGSAWVVTVAPPTSGPREAVLLRRLRALDPEIEAIEVQEFYFLRTKGGNVEEKGEALAGGVVGVLRDAAAAGGDGGAATATATAAAGSEDAAAVGGQGQGRHHHHHWRAYAPRPAFRSVWSSNARSILAARGLLADEEDPRLLVLEAGRWYRVTTASPRPLGSEVEALLHDRMTECAFPFLAPLQPQPQQEPQQARGGPAWGAVGATAMPTPLPPGLALDREPEQGTTTLPLRARGAAVLEEVSAKYGLGLGPWEMDFLTDLFWAPANGVERDPTEVEIFDVAQSLSEHCRHWTFDGRFVVDGADGREGERGAGASLMEMVKAPLARLRQQQEDGGSGGGDNSLLAFEDNSSAIRGPARVLDLQPARPDGPSPYVRVEVIETEIVGLLLLSLLKWCLRYHPSTPAFLGLTTFIPPPPPPILNPQGTRHPILTAETHNFPCSIAPFPGAQTGVGGRIRDILATGRGAKTLAGLAGYAVGDLRPSLDPSLGIPSRRPPHVASPLDILLRASDGASDYANKYGEPLLGGFARAMAPWPSAAANNHDNHNNNDNVAAAEFLKPIMFSAGIGALPDAAVRKQDPRPGMAVVKIGGPAYRVGLGGGAASSKVGGEPELDLQAVQRGDPAMGNRVGRVIRACVEMGEGVDGGGGGLLLASVHDQGAGGNANVLKELVAPEGADVYLGRVRRGDASLSPLEVWGAEYQESQGALVDGEAALAALRRVCGREAAPMEVVGRVTGHGRIRVFEGAGDEEEEEEEEAPPSPLQQPLVDLPLQPLLSHRPRRVIDATAALAPPWAAATTTTASATVGEPAAEEASSFDLRADLLAVLGAVAVGSKAFLTNKVDRSVTGLVAAQPCVGPLHLPVGDVGVAALSYWGKDGVATALGECPGVGLLDVKVRGGGFVFSRVYGSRLSANTRYPPCRI